VIEHDVENDLNAGPVQCFDHVAKFVDRPERISARAVTLMRSKERDRRVSPVIDLSRRGILCVELENRKKLDRGDPELLKIRNLLDQAGIRTSELVRYTGTGMSSEASHVHLIDDSPRDWPL
jgi:hypothetical protein